MLLTNPDLDVSMDAETQVVRDVKGNFQTGRGVKSETVWKSEKFEICTQWEVVKSRIHVRKQGG